MQTSVIVALTAWPLHMRRAKQVLALVQFPLLYGRCLVVALFVTAEELLYSAFLLDDLPVDLRLGLLYSLLVRNCLLLLHGSAPQGA